MPHPSPSYLHALERLEALSNYEKTGKASNLSPLTGIRVLLEKLDNPQKAYQIIHLAGTNGKGLTGAMLSQILCHEGKATGFYSSPHVQNIRERIMLQGQWVSPQAFASCAHAVLDVAENLASDHFISHFDVLTAIAFSVFKAANLEWVVLETGLGGTSDSTNVTPKKLCVITPIALDHVAILGSTLEAIAEQKLGILDANSPVVISEQPASLTPWFEAQSLTRSNRFVWVSTMKCTYDAQQVTIQWPEGNPQSHPSLQHRSVPFLECLRTALMARNTLEPGTDEEQQKWLASALSVQMPGRLQFLKNVFCPNQNHRIPLMVLDGGHNVRALEALVETLDSRGVQDYILILSFAQDKLIPELVPVLLRLARGAKTILLPQIQGGRAASSEQIRQALPKDVTLPTIIDFPDVEAILEWTAKQAPSPLVFSGSFQLVAACLPLIEIESDVSEQWPESLLFYLNWPRQRTTGVSMKERVALFLEAHRSQWQSMRIIKVAGTNGKGSSCAMLEACLQAHGETVGLFTSPHLFRVTERIRIAGQDVEMSELDAHAKSLRSDLEHLVATHGNAFIPSFFEVLLLLALRIFHERGVTVAIVEAGVGGSRDATSVLPSMLSAITSIGLDHLGQLGDTVEAIAADKAGIVCNPSTLILGPQIEPALKAVIHEHCLLPDKDIVQASKESIAIEQEALDGSSIAVTTPEDLVPCRIPLLGAHQVNNFSIVLEILNHLYPAHSVPECWQGVQNTQWPGRLEYFAQEPVFFLDVAHNSHALTTLITSLSPLVPFEERVVIFGTSEDKDFRASLDCLPQLAPTVHLVEGFHKAIPVQRYQEQAAQHRFILESKNTLSHTLTTLQERYCLTGKKLIVVGSVFLVGRVREFLIQNLK